MIWMWLGFIGYLVLVFIGERQKIRDAMKDPSSLRSKRRTYIYSNDDPVIPKGWIDHGEGE